MSLRFRKVGLMTCRYGVLSDGVLLGYVWRERLVRTVPRQPGRSAVWRYRGAWEGAQVQGKETSRREAATKLQGWASLRSLPAKNKGGAR